MKSVGEFFLWFLVPVTLLGVSIILELFSIAKWGVLLFRWSGITALGVLLLLQIVQWVMDFVRRNFSREVNQNGKTTTNSRNTD